MNTDTENEIVVVPKESALVAFTSPEGLDPFVEEVRKIVKDFDHDLSTGAGRKRTASLAAKVSRFKVRMDDMGKDLVADWKQKAKVVDDVRKRMRDDLDALRDEARAPLTAWEQAEEMRVADIKDRIEKIKGFQSRPMEDTSTTCKEDLAILDEMEIDDSFQEFKAEAIVSRDNAKAYLVQQIAKLEKEEADRAELARLKEEAEARRIADEQERLRKEGEERARKEAEEKIKAEQARIELEAKKAREESERRELEARRAKEEAERKEREAIEREERLKREAEEAKRKAEEDAIRRENEAEERAKREAEEAKRKEEEAEAKRKADAEHNRNLKTQAKLALVEAGLSESDAIKVIVAICDGKVPNISMRF